MITVQCCCNYLAISKKLGSILSSDDIHFNFSSLSFKVEKFKQITILLISNELELMEWIEVSTKMGSSKKNMSLKYVLPLVLSDKIKLQNRDYNGIPIKSEFTTEEIGLVRFLLRQKIDYFYSKINEQLDKTNKYLQGISPKLNWKNQVVISGEEVSNFINVQNFGKESLTIGDSIPMYKFWDFVNAEDNEQYIVFFINSEIYKLEKEILSEEVLRKLVLFSIFNHNYEQQRHALSLTDFLIAFYESVFQMAPFPIAIELSERDLIWQNKTFSNLKLLPRNVKKMVDHEKVHTALGFFIVYKHSFKVLDLEYKLVYLAQQSEKFSNASEDLGIMTSSLAHEMNNPLSAIKAAIEVLGILDKNFKNQETLDHMLTSVNRCLQLIKIFLGFTKASYQLGANGIIAADKIPFRECWEYAVQLMRTRLVSASLRLNFEWKVKSPFVVNNSNIMTMLLYWLLSQFVNYMERKFLISQSISQDQLLIISEDEYTLSIKLEVTVKEIILLLDQSLLMKHLLELEGLALKLNNENEILLSKNELVDTIGDA
jgi:signal transduction histidine kinase